MFRKPKQFYFLISRHTNKKNPTKPHNAVRNSQQEGDEKSGEWRTLVRRGFGVVQQALACVTQAKEPPEHPNKRRVLGCPLQYRATS